MSVSNNLEAAANAVVEDLANDVKGVLSNKDLESVPQIKALKQRVPDIQILSLDYDPDTSFANIENRLQMLVLNARDLESRAAG